MPIGLLLVIVLLVLGLLVRLVLSLICFRLGIGVLIHVGFHNNSPC